MIVVTCGAQDVDFVAVVCEMLAKIGEHLRSGGEVGPVILIDKEQAQM